jgi:MFS family permease
MVLTLKIKRPIKLIESPELKHKLEKNIQKIYYLKFFTMFNLLMPVIVPFFESKGAGMRGVYTLQAVFAATVFLLEIPSGYISDILGRKKSLLLSAALKGVGFSLFPLADDLTVLIIAEVILGIAVSLNSGSDTALIYDTLEATGSKKAQIKILGRSISYFSLGEALASLLASILMMLSFNIDHLAIISALTSWIGFIITATLVEPPRQKMGTKHQENFSYIYQGLFKQTRLLNLIILNSILSSTGTLIAVWLFQKYWHDIKIPMIYFGFLWALTNLVVSFTSRHAHKIEKFWGSSNVILIIGSLPIAGYLGISFIDHSFGILACLLFKVCRGWGQVIFRDALNKRVTGDFRATANSITQMGVRILFILLGPLLGFLIDSKGLQNATTVMAGLYTIVFIFAILPLLRERHNFIKIK